MLSVQLFMLLITRWCFIYPSRFSGYKRYFPMCMLSSRRFRYKDVVALILINRDVCSAQSDLGIKMLLHSYQLTEMYAQLKAIFGISLLTNISEQTYDSKSVRCIFLFYNMFWHQPDLYIIIVFTCSGTNQDFYFYFMTVQMIHVSAYSVQQ